MEWIEAIDDILLQEVKISPFSITNASQQLENFIVKKMYCLMSYSYYGCYLYNRILLSNYYGILRTIICIVWGSLEASLIRIYIYVSCFLRAALYPHSGYKNQDC